MDGGLSELARATGTFEVERETEPPYETVEGVALARTHLVKRFHGDLEATSTAWMLSAGGGAPGSAGYVAIERVAGSLGGKRGTFVLQHSGIMERGSPSLSITVVPDSATGELCGLSGRMQVEISDGGHSYTFEYELAPAAI